MIKLIFKNLIAHKGRNLWILLELCLATVISWELLDDVIISEVVGQRHLGYDIERLATFRFNELSPEAMPTDHEERTIDEKMNDVRRILDIIRSDNRVETATIADNSIFDGISIATSSAIKSELKDSMIHESYLYIRINFWRETDFFKTFGLKDATGNELKDFEEKPMRKSDVVISSTIAEFLFPGEKALGRSINEKDRKFDRSNDRGLIAGIVNEASARSLWERSPIVYEPKNDKDVERAGGIGNLRGVIRLKPGVDVRKFVRDYEKTLTEDLNFGEIYCRALVPYTEMRETMRRDTNNKNFIAESIALFFFVNILLCMTGTFYLQVRRRSAEAGIMRTFGATRGSIIRGMLGEGFVLVTVGWAIGCLIFRIINKGQDLANNFLFSHKSETVMQLMPRWYDDFWIHFTVVSLIIYVILLSAVFIGIYIPARKIADSNPVDTLNAE